MEASSFQDNPLVAFLGASCPLVEVVVQLTVAVTSYMPQLVHAFYEFPMPFPKPAAANSFAVLKLSSTSVVHYGCERRNPYVSGIFDPLNALTFDASSSHGEAKTYHCWSHFFAGPFSSVFVVFEFSSQKATLNR